MKIRLFDGKKAFLYRINLSEHQRQHSSRPPQNFILFWMTHNANFTANMMLRRWLFQYAYFAVA
eukprot:UN16730